MSEATRVVLADDHAPLRAGVRRALEERGFEVVAEVADARAAVKEALDHRPDVCLLDLYMPGGGIVAGREIKSALPDCAVIMLTVSESERDLFQALAAGVDGYLLKTIAADRLPDAVIGALRGEAALPRSLTTRVISEFHRSQRRRASGTHDGGQAAVLAQLSSRELEVLELLLEGLTTAAIADRLGISAVTVRRHISSIVRASGAANRRGAVEALRRALAHEGSVAVQRDR